MTGIPGSSLGLLGKAPGRGDFLRVHAGASAFAAFDEWLVQSVEWASSRAGAEWPQAYAAGAMHVFVYRPQQGGIGSVLTGALVPSADSAGRSFPLVAASALTLDTALVGAPHLLPLLLEQLWQTSSTIAANARSQPLLDLELALRDAPLEAPLDFAEARASYAEWSQELPLHELWDLVLTADRQVAARFALLGEAIRPFRGMERPSTPLTLRLPLGRAAGVAVCFWLDVVCRLAGWEKTLPSFFWTHDGENGSLLLHLGQPPRSTVAELWLPSGRRDEFCDLTRPPRNEVVAVLPPTAPRLSSVLEDRGSTVADLLAATRVSH